MNPNVDPNAPLLGTGYMPYVYAAGLFQTYGRPRPRKFSDQGAEYRSSPYDFSSDRSLWSAHDGPQTVEQVLASGYFAIPHSDPETALISDRQHVAGLGLDDVITQIRHRQSLYQQNMTELAYSVCEANNSVFRQEAAQGHPADNRQQYSAHKQIQELYEQQREERVNLWRDVSRLRLVLPENLQNYLGAYRKLAILNDSTATTATPAIPATPGPAGTLASLGSDDSSQWGGG